MASKQVSVTGFLTAWELNVPCSPVCGVIAREVAPGASFIAVSEDIKRLRERGPHYLCWQFVGEVIMSRDKTIQSDEFRDLEHDVELRRQGLWR